jgi:hypothetical protein
MHQQKAISRKAIPTAMMIKNLTTIALGCAYGDKTRQVLEHTMLWMGSMGATTGELGTIQKMNKECLLT